LQLLEHLIVFADHLFFEKPLSRPLKF